MSRQLVVPPLKPCPFCGFELPRLLATFVICDACKVVGPVAADRYSAHRAWNDRMVIELRLPPEVLEDSRRVP